MNQEPQRPDDPQHYLSKSEGPVTSDQLVVSKDVLDAILEIRRQGADRLIRDMEACEPALCEFFLEESTNLLGELARLGLRPRRLRAMNERIQCFGLTLVRSLRCAQLRLWDQAEALPVDPPAARPDNGESPDSKNRTP
jgi:hypothetical protein